MIAIVGIFNRNVAIIQELSSHLWNCYHFHLLIICIILKEALNFPSLSNPVLQNKQIPHVKTPFKSSGSREIPRDSTVRQKRKDIQFFPISTREAILESELLFCCSPLGLHSPILCLSLHHYGWDRMEDQC